jgi:chemotaxis protein methyltransferase CheR
LDSSDKTLIFATGTSPELAQEAWDSTVPAARIAECEDNYRRSGGQVSLGAYFEGPPDQLSLLARLRKNIVWGQHNLVTDASFNEFQLIVCRGVLTDFGPLLCSRTLRLLHDSLAIFGILSIDLPDNVASRYLTDAYRSVCGEQGVFKRVL